MTIEQFIVEYLNDGNLPQGVTASGSVPHPMPAQFVTVEKTGSSLSDRIHGATIAVQSWSTSRAAAAALNEAVKSAMEAAAALPEISRSALESDYNYTDLATNKPRYQAVFDVVHYI